MDTYDVIVIGSGIAALQTALHASRTKRVLLITKTKIRSCNTYLAQGGVAAALPEEDDVESHSNDTLNAGRFHNDAKAVDRLTSKGVEAVHELVCEGMNFDRDRQGQLAFGLEGAHSKRRILHCEGDSTGKALLEFLWEKVISSTIEYLEDYRIIELRKNIKGECIGVTAKSTAGTVCYFYASATVLATGGCGQLYPYTTNHENACGDGFALALKAGAALKDMEFMQFHPTGLYCQGEVKGLVSEAVRGEGAVLITEDGRRIMRNVHPLEDLAPRHIVSQTIFSHFAQDRNIFLDIGNVNGFPLRFPTIASLCEINGVDLKNGRIPVAPASHFMMGGIEVDTEGATSVPGLYAVGEVACTGVHGANRLASNSLLEGLAFGKELGLYLADRQMPRLDLREKNKPPYVKGLELPSLMAIREKMFHHAGILRNREGLSELLDWLQQFRLTDLLLGSLDECDDEDITAACMMLTSWSIAQSAILRKESRGAHLREDFSGESADWQRVSIVISGLDMEGKVIHEYSKA
ncbi:L-aspartate oxidase [Bacillus sp. 1P06AnD]|uniref:L-aspartate oxidase n=1 Tax=Bacillus sp. 1P06AnD TaxID=3132208 RepID=UPI0039A23974